MSEWKLTDARAFVRALFSRIFRTYWWVTRLKFTEDLYFANLSRYFLSLWNNDRWRTPHRSMWGGDGNQKLIRWKLEIDGNQKSEMNSYSIHLLWTIHRVGFPGGSVSIQETQVWSWVRKIPWRMKWQPTPGFLPGKSHGQRSLAVYSLWACKKKSWTRLSD